MASLTAKSAYSGLVPIEVGRNRLSECPLDAITWLSPDKGQSAAVSKALEKQIKVPFPDPNRATGTEPSRAVWFGPAQALVLGPALSPIKGAAMVDQTSAWAVATLEGPDAAAILARLVPVDLRDDSFAPGHAARTLLGHMNCTLTRAAPDRFDILVFRSMAKTAAHEIERAMRMVAARAEH